MLLSMTAFARKQTNCGRGVLVWEIRSVNHRYLEPGFRFPDALRGLEPVIRDALRKHISRGKVDCQLRLECDDKGHNALQIDEEAVVRLNDASGQILSLTGGGPALTVMEILKWPGVLRESAAVPEDLEEKALALFHETLTDLIHTRRREGQELLGFISKRIDAVREIVNTVRVRMPEILARLCQPGRLPPPPRRRPPSGLEQCGHLLGCDLGGRVEPTRAPALCNRGMNRNTGRCEPVCGLVGHRRKITRGFPPL